MYLKIILNNLLQTPIKRIIEITKIHKAEIYNSHQIKQIFNILKQPNQKILSA